MPPDGAAGVQPAAGGDRGGARAARRDAGRRRRRSRRWRRGGEGLRVTPERLMPEWRARAAELGFDARADRDASARTVGRSRESRGGAVRGAARPSGPDGAALDLHSARPAAGALGRSDRASGSRSTGCSRSPTVLGPADVVRDHRGRARPRYSVAELVEKSARSSSCWQLGVRDREPGSARRARASVASAAASCVARGSRRSSARWCAGWSRDERSCRS